VFRQKSHFALDVGSTNVKVVQVRRTRGGLELEKFACVPIYPAGRPDSNSDIRSATVTAIQRAVDAANITSKNVISSISGDAIIVRYIQLPVMTEDELKNALQFEAEEYIPFPIDEVNLASHILGEAEDITNRRMNVLLVAAKRDLVSEHVDIVRAAGLVPRCVDVDSFAIYNCFTHVFQPSPEDVAVIVDIGADITNINIYHSDTSHFARDIKIGGNTITSAIQQKLNVDFMEAENLKYTDGLHVVAAPTLPDDGYEESDSSLMASIQGAVENMADEALGEDDLESQTSRTVRNALNSLLTEVRRSLQFFENQVAGKPVNRLVLSGGTAKLPNLAEFFSQELGIPVDILDPVAGISVNDRLVDENALANCRELLGVSMGLALREVA
jgi:type IV pilus assembly protein PilM